MSTYIKLFETTAQYTTYMTGDPYLPNVSLCEDAPTTVHYTPYVPVPPSNPVIEGEYAVDDDSYAEESTTFPIIIDKAQSGWEPGDADKTCTVRIKIENNTPLSEGLNILYRGYGTNVIGDLHSGWGDPAFSGMGLKVEKGAYDGHFQKFERSYPSSNIYIIKIISDETDNAGKIYYEDQSGNKWYLFEWEQG